MITLQKDEQLIEKYNSWKDNGFYLNYSTSFTNLRNNQDRELREIYKSIKHLKIKKQISETIEVHKTFSEAEFEELLREAIDNDELFNRHKNTILADADKRNITDELKITFENYKTDNSRTWIKQDYLTKIQYFLFPTSHEKCVYCERKPNQGGGNLEVEHFYPKKNNDFENAFSFENLLPSCKQCNTQKAIRYEIEIADIQYEILNPYNENSVKQHIGLDLISLKLLGISNNGKTTVKLLNTSLNTDSYIDDNFKSQKGTLHFRKEIARQIYEKFVDIRELKEDIERNIANNNLEEALILKGRIIRKIKSIIDTEINPENSLTATRATIILTHKTLREICEFIREFNEAEYNEIEQIINEKRKYCLETF